MKFQDRRVQSDRFVHNRIEKWQLIIPVEIVERGTCWGSRDFLTKTVLDGGIKRKLMQGPLRLMWFLETL